MPELLPPHHLLLPFLAAAFALSYAPGPGVVYIVTQSTVHGQRAGLASAAGIALGNLGNAIAASAGLAALFALSSHAYTVVKYIGVFYLIYLGLQVLRTVPAQNKPAITSNSVFRDGLILALFNPKTTLFFAAFLPQFLSLSGPPLGQTLILGTLFVTIATITDTLYALAASTLAPILAQSSLATLGRLAGSVYLGLALWTALAPDNRQPTRPMNNSIFY